MKSLLLLPFHQNTIHSLSSSPTSSSLHITTRQHRLTNCQSQLRFLPSQFPTLPRESINSQRTHCRINDFISLCINNGQGETNLTPASTCSWVEIYSLRGMSKLLAGKPEGWNREHLWPRSYGLTDGPSLTDLHNIRPADVNVNSSRGNKYYGECLAISTHCLKPANKEAAYDTETDKKLWAPPLQVRGDIARSLMYMATTYGFSQSDGSQNLRLSDSPSAENSEMGLLSTLLKWNEVDPPSRTEKLRNNRVCKLYQHNRNPFVDHPEYANLIWTPHTPTTGQTKYIPRKAWINEFHYNNKGKDKNEVDTTLWNQT